jgi:putative ABC transport system substrate-binding protein
MRRREFIGFVGGVLASPIAARAQQPAKVARVGYLGFGTPAAAATRIEALRAGLNGLGYVEGKNIAIEFRWAKNADELRGFADELVAQNVDIIFVTSSTETGPARQATRTIPIVFATHADPVGTGHVASLARPGGNITGLSVLLSELTGKALEISKKWCLKRSVSAPSQVRRHPVMCPLLELLKLPPNSLGYHCTRFLSAAV